MSIYKFEAASSRRTREWRDSYHYAIYEHRLPLEDGKAYEVQPYRSLRCQPWIRCGWI